MRTTTLRSSVLAACVIIIALHPVDAQVPSGTALDLKGFKPTLDLDASDNFNLVSGELPWWGGSQLAAMPFSTMAARISFGLPPNASWPVNSSAPPLKSANGYAAPYYSGYTNEAEAYPNADEMAALGLSAGVSAAVATANGVLALTASRISPVESARLPPQIQGRSYVSGALNTYPYSQRYGYFELDGQIPAGPGLWPAFWMVPENMNEAGDTEIDVMEIVGGQEKVLNSTLHTTDRTSPSFPALTRSWTAPVDLAQGFHRYGVDWEPLWITFYLDGAAFYSTPTPADMHMPMYVIANLAVGTRSSWGGAPTSATSFPASFNIESIRAWSPPG